MQIQISLSKREKQHYFLYLLGMVFIVIVLIVIVLLFKYKALFAEKKADEVKNLKELVVFRQEQDEMLQMADTTFLKLSKLGTQEETSMLERDITYNLERILTFSKDANFVDVRRQSFSQIYNFYKMYEDDKRDLQLVKRNIEEINKQLQECKIGYKFKKEQLNVRGNNSN